MDMEAVLTAALARQAQTKNRLSRSSNQWFTPAGGRDLTKSHWGRSPSIAAGNPYRCRASLDLGPGPRM